MKRAGRSTTTRSLLRRRDFRLLLAAFSVSRAGEFLFVVALVVYVYQQTGSATWVSVAAFLRLVPHAVLSPLAGVVADRYERRTVMVVSALAQFVLMAAVTVTSLRSGPAAVVVVLGLLRAVAATIYGPSMTAMTQRVVPTDQLAAANSLVSVVDSVAYTAGPAVGGVLLLLGHPAAAFGIDAVTMLISAGCLMAIRERSRSVRSRPKSGAVRDLEEGISALVHNRTVLVLVTCVVAAMLVYGVELVVLILVSIDLLGMGPPGLGWLMVAIGVGGLVGAALAPRLGRTPRPRLALAVLVLLNGVPFAMLSVVREPVLALVVLLGEGAASFALDVLVQTGLQRGVAPAVLGRVSGLVVSFAFTATVVGTLVAPVLLGAIGLPATLLLSGLVPVSLALLSLLLVPDLDAQANRRRRELAPQVTLLGRLRLVQGADVASLERLAAGVERQRSPAGTVVMRQGDPADDILILASGELVVDHALDGSTRRVNHLVAPDYIGEIGLLERRPRTATVTVSSEAVLWRIPGELFLDVVTAGPALSRTLASGVASRLSRTPGAAP